MEVFASLFEDWPLKVDSQETLMTEEQIITIDGSQGEGGGQILRSSVGLAAVTGQPLRVSKIRAGRSKPGLMRQHLTAINAASEICSGDLKGAEPGSQEVLFFPGPVSAGNYHFSVGTAGSATLVLQTILPALLTAGGNSEIVIEGGTHNQWAPPFDFLDRVYLPLINRMGPRVHAVLDRYGFYPAGGGRIVVTIEPCPALAGFDLCERGEVISKKGRILLSNLPLRIADREADVLIRRLSLLQKEVDIDIVTANGPGNLVFVEIAFEHVTETVTGFGRVGASAEHVAQEVVRQVRSYLKSTAPIGEYLADQLLLPLGLSAAQASDVGVVRGGTFRTQHLSKHAQTHREILQRMLPVRIETADSESGSLVTIKPN